MAKPLSPLTSDNARHPGTEQPTRSRDAAHAFWCPKYVFEQEQQLRWTAIAVYVTLCGHLRHRADPPVGVTHLAVLEALAGSGFRRPRASATEEAGAVTAEVKGVEEPGASEAQRSTAKVMGMKVFEEALVKLAGADLLDLHQDGQRISGVPDHRLPFTFMLMDPGSKQQHRWQPKGSFWLDRRIFDFTPQIGAEGLAVYSRIIKALHDEDGAKIGEVRLDRELGSDSKQIRKVVKKLQACGLVERTNEGREQGVVRGPAATNVYRPLTLEWSQG